MTPRHIAVLGEAHLDVEAAALWYEGQRAGLGMRFLDELDRILGRVRKHPLQFPQIEQSVRRALLRRFPYGVYFSLEAEQEVVVFAVLHLHRDPDTWKLRRSPGDTAAGDEPG